MADKNVTVPVSKVTKALKDKRKKWREAYHKGKSGKSDAFYTHLAKLLVAAAKEI